MRSHSKTQGEINMFILERAQEAGSPAAATTAKRQRDQEHEDEHECDHKAIKLDASLEAKLDLPLVADGLLRCVVRTFKGNTYVDLRQFYSVRPDSCQIDNYKVKHDICSCLDYMIARFLAAEVPRGLRGPFAVALYETTRN
jgi:hypothetical protein